MGEAARLRVIDQFTLRQTVDTFRSIYRELSAPGRYVPGTAGGPVPARVVTAAEDTSRPRSLAG